MRFSFKEMRTFEKIRAEYLTDEDYRLFQLMLMENPKCGALIKGTRGLRKVRFPDSRRGKGSRGGVRIIYYWYVEGEQFWLFTIYNKNEMADLTNEQRAILAMALQWEVEAHGKT